MTRHAAAACGLPAAWAGQTSWQVLDMAFGDGEAFVNTWNTWAHDDLAPERLHYVGLTALPPALDALGHCLRTQDKLAEHLDGLQDQWFGFLPGLHRISLCGGRLLLTLCVGEALPMMRDLHMSADSVYAATPSDPQEAQVAHGQSRWIAKAIARLSRVGTTLAIGEHTAELQPWLCQAGFVIDNKDSGPSGTMRYQPRWVPRLRRATPTGIGKLPSACAIVGAGLAGAAAAHALATRGWQVTLIDAAPTPACGASAVPVGLLVPHTSRDDGPRSQLSRAGVRLTLELCRRLLVHGTDWCHSGVAELRAGQVPRLAPDWPVAGRDWSVPRDDAIWHRQAGWVKPQRLVQRCVAANGITFMGNSRVGRIDQAAGAWVLYDTAGQELTRAQHVVLALAGGTVQLSASVQAQAMVQHPLFNRLQATDGQLSFAAQLPAVQPLLPPQPVNGHGFFIPHVPGPDGVQWYAGATYEGVSDDSAATPIAHQDNRRRLARLLPRIEQELCGHWTSDTLRAWRGRRWSTADRLPLVGALEPMQHPGLWLSTGMGSRGLTFCVLAAELLAAQMCSEPWPTSARLARLLDPRR